MITKLIFFLMVLLWTLVGVARMLLRFIMDPFGFFSQDVRNVTPACLADPEFEHGYLTLTDRNVRIHYVSTGHPSKPLLLCLHGFPEFWYSWRHQLRYFKDAYRVVAIDMRGYGDSSKPAGIDSYAIPELVGDVKCFVEDLGYSSCVLMAHDWGGVVAWQVVISCPDLVEKFIVCNCPHPSAFRKQLGSPKQMLKSWYMFFFQSPFLPELSMKACDYGIFDELFVCKNKDAFSYEDMEAFKYTFSRPGALTPPLNYYRAAMQRNTRIRPKGSSSIVNTPTLILWGTNDLALSTELANSSAEYCTNSEMFLIDGASHWVQQDEPELCNKYIATFLGSQ